MSVPVDPRAEQILAGIAPLFTDASLIASILGGWDSLLADLAEARVAEETAQRVAAEAIAERARRDATCAIHGGFDPDQRGPGWCPYCLHNCGLSGAYNADRDAPDLAAEKRAEAAEREVAELRDALERSMAQTEDAIASGQTATLGWELARDRAGAAEREVAELRDALAVERLVDRFLSWPMPDSVCSDPCVTVADYGVEQGWPKRSGTNLLTAVEARAMIEHVFPAARGRKEPSTDEPQQVAWLIERGQPEQHAPTVWWSGDESKGWGGWVPDAWQAMRFQSKGQADVVIRHRFTRPGGSDPNCHAAEHVFLSARGRKENTQ